jgi:2,4-dienoyl-CoA reductase-like NADH-dependent reductase (Old Yellow Enzyme family)
MRLALEIFAALRSACGDETLILYRHTPEGKGYGIRESCVLAEALSDAGVDLLDLSPSSREFPGDQAAPFTALGLPTIAVGQLHYVEHALDVLANGRAHLVAIGRGLIADPEWPKKVKDGRFSEIIECIACNKGCHENLRKGIPVRCVKWGT